VDEVKKRETYKDIKLSNRDWRIRKFDALTGSYMAYQLLNLALPPMIGKMLANTGIPLNTEKDGRMMTKQEFTAFQKDCLSVCFENLKAREAPVIDTNGNWGVADLENDLNTVLMLTIYVLAFNVESFFGEGPLKGLEQSLSDTSQ
jgi:hypothetical protein